MKKVEIIPTIVPDSFSDLVEKQLKLAQFTSAIHIDITDGVFAPDTTWLPTAEDSLPDAAAIFYESHLMVSEPQEIGTMFAKAGARRVIGHVEAFGDASAVEKAFNAWHSAGATEVGLGILFDTPLLAIEPYVSMCDSVLIMTIATIGKQGIPFDPRGIERVREMHKRFPDLTIAVDGGVSEENIAELVKAGASRLSVGSAISRAHEPRAVYNRLLELANTV